VYVRSFDDGRRILLSELSAQLKLAVFPARQIGPLGSEPRPAVSRGLARGEPLDHHHLVADVVVAHLIHHSLTDQEAEAADVMAEFLTDVPTRERVARDRCGGQTRAIGALPLVTDHDFQVVVVHPVGDVDQTVGLLQVAPLDRVLAHLHYRLPQLDDQVIGKGRRLADQHQEVVQVLEEIDLAT
jgi:hypothetical protein